MKLNMNVPQISGNLFFRGSATGLNLLLEDCIDCTHLPSCLLCAAIFLFSKKTYILQLHGCFYIWMLSMLQWFQGNKPVWNVLHTSHTLLANPGQLHHTQSLLSSRFCRQTLLHYKSSRSVNSCYTQHSKCVCSLPHADIYWSLVLCTTKTG